MVLWFWVRHIIKVVDWTFVAVDLNFVIWSLQVCTLSFLIILWFLILFSNLMLDKKRRIIDLCSCLLIISLWVDVLDKMLYEIHWYYTPQLLSTAKFKEDWLSLLRHSHKQTLILKLLWSTCLCMDRIGWLYLFLHIS